MTLLQDRRVLVLEDEWFLAEELVWMLKEQGAVVVGPYPSLEEAMTIALNEIDGAVLNVRVRGSLSYPLAQRLRAYGIPFVFASGQDNRLEPAEWRDNVWLDKPYEARKLIAALVRVMGCEQA